MTTRFPNVAMSAAYRRHICWKGVAAGILSLLATGAMADVAFEETGGGVRVVIVNKDTPSGLATYSYDLPEGRIVVHEDSTPNNACWEPCPDTLTVIDWPEGFATVPGDMIEVPEGGTGEILILPMGIS